MGLLSHGIAFALGYAIGQPQGRARLAQAGRQAADLAQRPEVVRLREQGKQLAVEQAQSIKQKVRSGSKGDTEGDIDGAAGSDDRGAAAAAPRGGLRAPKWRPRFSRSRTAHFPPSQNPEPPSALGGTTVMEDSEAARLGTPAVRPPDTPPSTDRT